MDEWGKSGKEKSKATIRSVGVKYVGSLALGRLWTKDKQNKSRLGKEMRERRDTNTVLSRGVLDSSSGSAGYYGHLVTNE